MEFVEGFFEASGGFPRGTKESVALKVSVVIQKDEHGYYAFCPELKGCHTQGDSLDEVLRNIKEAVSLYLETLSDEEKREWLSEEILTTSVEVEVA